MDKTVFVTEAIRQKYSRTVILMLLKAFEDVIGSDNVNLIKVESSLDGNIYILPDLKVALTEELVQLVKEKMHSYVKEGVPIRKETMPTADAVDYFAERGMEDTSKLFRYRRTSYVNLTSMLDYKDYFEGSVYANASYAGIFDLILYHEGLLLLLPEELGGEIKKDYQPAENIFETFNKAYRWSDFMDVQNIADLNDVICQGKFDELVITCEARYQRQISKAAEMAIDKGVKFILLAGPSSSGKTTTANRLAITLRALGKNARVISADNYYLDGDKTPLTPDGKRDIESIYAIDLELFNSDMQKLLKGETIELPEYDFKATKRVYKGEKLTLDDNMILIFEGIHCMNEIFSAGIPADQKMKVYASALSQININEHNRMSTTDLRLMRRMIRDNRTRGYDPINTIDVWPGVVLGERANIFPYQDQADIVINTAMAYEYAVLKPHAEQLLFNVPKESPEYYKARSILKFLDFILPVFTEAIPRDSVIREFIGGSCLKVG